MTRTLLPAAALALFLAGAATAPGVAAQTLPWQGTPTLQTQLYFGLRTATGTVSAAQWASFLAQVVTPRFPDGLTVLDAYGQSRASLPQPGAALQDTTKVLIIVHPNTAAAAQALGEIKNEYLKRFEQTAVFHVDMPARIVP